MEQNNKHKTKLKWLYCMLVAIPISTYIVENASEEDYVSALIFTAIGLLIVSLVIIDQYDLAVFLGASLSSWFIYGMTWSHDRFFFGFPLWIVSILAILYRSYKRRKKLSLPEEVLHLAGAVILIVFAFYQYVIADQITEFINMTHGAFFESEGLMRPTLRYMPIFLLVCYYSKSIWGYVMSILVCYRSWALVRYGYSSGKKLDFHTGWDENQTYFLKFARDYIDKMLETGIFAMKFLGVMIAVRIIILTVNKVREVNKIRKTEEKLFKLCIAKAKAYLKAKLKAYDFKKMLKPLLKFYAVFAIMLIVYIVGCIIMDTRDRNAVSKHGLEGFKFSEYEESYELLDDIEFVQSTYTQQYYYNSETIDIYNDEKRSLGISYFNNVFDYCTINISSTGYADYWEGSYISLDDVEDVVIDTPNGRVKMELTGKTEFTLNYIEYKFKIYPLDEMTIQEFENLDLNIVLKGAKIMYYER